MTLLEVRKLKGEMFSHACKERNMCGEPQLWGMALQHGDRVVGGLTVRRVKWARKSVPELVC